MNCMKYLYGIHTIIRAFGLQILKRLKSGRKKTGGGGVGGGVFVNNVARLSHHGRQISVG